MSRYTANGSSSLSSARWFEHPATLKATMGRNEPVSRPAAGRPRGPAFSPALTLALARHSADPIMDEVPRQGDLAAALIV